MDKFEINYLSNKYINDKNIISYTNPEENIINNQDKNIHISNKLKLKVNIYHKKRHFIFAIRKINNKSPECFQIIIKKETKIKLSKFKLKNFLKTIVMFLMFIFLWVMLSFFINELVNKYGDSVFEMCIFPVFYMFLVNLIIVLNLKFLLMTIILYKKGKIYINMQKKPFFDLILFKCLVSPMALDHFESIINYQEYVKNTDFIDINAFERKLIKKIKEN